MNRGLPSLCIQSPTPRSEVRKARRGGRGGVGGVGPGGGGVRWKKGAPRSRASTRAAPVRGFGKEGGEAGKEGGGPRSFAPPSLAAPLAPGRGAGRERLPRTAAAAAGTGHVPRGSPLPALPLGSLSWHRPSVLFIIHFIYTPPPHKSLLLLFFLIY